MPERDDFMGTQPVRVLAGNLLAWFEGKYPEFRRELKEIGRTFGATRVIKYVCNEEPIVGHKQGNLTPYVTVAEGQIGIHETFLSYVWGLSYGFLVIFDEQIHGPSTGREPSHGKPLGYFTSRGYEVLNHALGLIAEFETWPPNLPNPENCAAEDRFFVERANAIYLAAVDFILCHELAHVACGHLKRRKETDQRGEHITPAEIKKLEGEADKWAFDCVSRGIRGPERSATTVGFGAVTGLGSLLFLNRGLTSGTHPDKDDRIGSVLSGLSLDEKDSLWGVAAAFYMAWDQRFQAGLDISGEFDTYQALVQAILGQLESIKREEQDRQMGLD